MADLAMQNNITPPDFKTFIDNFGSSICIDYDVNTGSGNIKRAKTEGRLLAMFHEFIRYFKIPEDSGCSPVGIRINPDKNVSGGSSENGGIEA